MTDDRRADAGHRVEPADPVAMARRDLKKALPRRFYREAAAAPADGGYGVHLDGRPVRTPAKAPLVVPTHALAEALAAEWRAQGEIVEPDSMPLSRLVNSAIDGVARHRDATIDEVATFAETDLVCYRAGEPAPLVAAQAAAWDPVLVFARDQLGARFFCTQGVSFAAQPASALAAVRRAVQAAASGAGGDLRLAALGAMTSLYGSVLIALAVTRGAMTAEAGWTAAHVDEDHQTALWGQDREALARRCHRERDMLAASRLYALSEVD